MHTRESVKIGTETILAMLSEYQLAYALVPHFPRCSFIHILLARTCMCFSLQSNTSYRRGLLMILRLSVFSLSGSLSHSLQLSHLLWRSPFSASLSSTPSTSPIRPPPPPHNFLLCPRSGLFTRVSMQSSHLSPPLSLSLSNPLLSFLLQPSFDFLHTDIG